jgi:hypothetical protein
MKSNVGHVSRTKAHVHFTPWRSYPYANAIPIAAARSATTPLATRWPADDLELDEVDDGVAEPVVAVAAGGAVATAFTPPVTGPLSGTCK